MYFDWEYRLYVLQGAVQRFLLPPLVLFIALRPTRVRFSLLHVAGALAANQALQWAIRAYRDWNAQRVLGARPPQEARGRWPFNIDLMLTFVFKKNHSSYNAKAILDAAGTHTLNVRMLGSDMYLTRDEQLVKHMLATSFDDFVKGDTQRLIAESFLGNGIFNRDGELWKLHRTMTRPFFSRDRISDMHILGKQTTKFINIILQRCRTGSQRGAIEIQDLFARLTMDSGSEFLFAHCMRTLDQPLPDPDHPLVGIKGSLAPPMDPNADEELRRCAEFVQAFESMVNVTEARSKGAAWMLLEFLHDNNARHIKVARRYLDGYIENALERRARTGASDKNDDETTLLDFMLSNCSDMSLVRDELLNIMVAARDTTATALTFATYLFSMHPDAFQRVREEVLALCGRDGTPTFEQLRNLRYLRAVLNETLRLFPPVPSNMRTCAKSDVAIPIHGDQEKMYIPAGTPVMYVPLLMHRRKDLWGEDAEAFDPERWLDPERVSRYTKNPFMWIPFNAGPRICLGQQFAYNNLSFIVARLAQRFAHVELAEDVQPAESKPLKEWKDMPGRIAQEKIWPATGVTLFIKGGLWVRFTEDETAA